MSGVKYNTIVNTINTLNKFCTRLCNFFLSCLEWKEGFCLKACLIFPITTFYLIEDITSFHKPCPASAKGYSNLLLPDANMF